MRSHTPVCSFPKTLRGASGARWSNEARERDRMGVGIGRTGAQIQMLILSAEEWLVQPCTDNPEGFLESP